MSEVKTGDVVSVEYTGKLDNQVIFDSTENRDPLHFIVGSGSLIEKFEEAVIGLKVGDTRSIKIGYQDAYGPVQPDAIMEVSKSDMPEGLPLEVGMPLRYIGADGQYGVVKVVEIRENSVMVDANHPLAGENLNFDIKVVGINQMTPEELEAMYHSHSCNCGEGGCGDENCDCGDEEACDCDESSCGCGHQH
jgi:peptidylprolyl isomerase